MLLPWMLLILNVSGGNNVMSATMFLLGLLVAGVVFKPARLALVRITR
jgi:hypothetical protein